MELINMVSQRFIRSFNNVETNLVGINFYKYLDTFKYGHILQMEIAKSDEKLKW